LQTNFKSPGIKILELNFERSWRGGEKQTLFNMAGFRNSGHDVALLCRKGSPLQEKANESGFETFGFSNIFTAFFFMLFRCKKYDVLHAQSSHILTYAVLSKRFHHATIIFTRRIFKTPKGRFTKWKYKKTEKLVAISPAIKKIMEEFTGKNVSLISDAVEERELNPQRARELVSNLNIGESNFIIGTTAALTTEKAPLVMIEAIHDLWNKRKDFVFLHFGIGPLQIEMEELIKRYQLEKVYYLMGFIDNVEDIFLNLKIFAMSSELEGLGSSVLDAFVYKVPVVSTNAGGLADLLENERGILCEKNDPKMLAEGIDKMLSDTLLRENVIRNAYAYVKKFHSLNYITDQYLALINSL
jgi:glycosyltransferase involved in cell wall biosynthesis